jgi:hypothetical protein
MNKGPQPKLNFMRIIETFLILFIILNFSFNGSAQLYNSSESMFRFHEDNDFINFRGHGTDKAYTNGTSFDLYYNNENASHKKLNKWIPKAGSKAHDTYKWGITQIMYTPTEISLPNPDPMDFSYAGALYVSRSLHSSNPVKKISYQTDLFAGLIGPFSFAKETQIGVHKLIASPIPMGWDHQISTKIIANINFTAEQELWNYGKWLELIGGTQFKAGSLVNAVTAHSILRVGKMNPYFNGYFSRFKGNSSQTTFRHNYAWQIYAVLKPSVEYQFNNSLLSDNNEAENQKSVAPPVKISANQAIPNQYLFGFDYGFYMVCQHTSIAITQKIESPAIKGASSHEVGNISLYTSW